MSSLKSLLFPSLIFLLFFNSFILNINKPPSLYLHEDTYVSMFILNHYYETFKTGDLKNLPNPSFMAGFPNSLFFSDHLLIQGLLSLPIFFIFKDPVLSYNVFLILTLYASFISMYFFTKTVISTYSGFPALISAMIYIFNPYVMAHFPGFIMQLTLYFIPLIFLTLELFARTNKSKYAVLFFLLLSAQLLSSLYHTAVLSVILPLYILLRKDLRDKFFHPNKKIIFGFLIFAAVALADYWVYKNALPISSKAAIGEDVYSAYSAWPSDYLFTISGNLLYGGLKEKFAKTLPDFVHFGMDWEHSLFPGITVLMLLFFGLFFFFKEKKPHQKPPQKPQPTTHNPPPITLFLILLTLTFLLTFGPHIHLTTQLSIPGPFSILKLIPFFSYIRVPPRFAFIMFFFIAAIIGMFRFRYPLLKTILILFIFLEFLNKPLAYEKPDQEALNFFEKVKNDLSISTILHLPIGNFLPAQSEMARPEDLDAHYLYYQMLHKKKILNGFVSFVPESYYELTNSLSINFPTRSKISSLKKLNVDTIILHKGEFSNSKIYDQMVNDLIEMGLAAKMKTSNLSLFQI